MLNSDQIPYLVAAVLGANTLLFILVHIFTKRDNSWIDAMWAMCFCIPNALIWGLRG